MKAGILGGTFDPVHIAHLIIAEEARTRLDLDRVIFIPSGVPWMKADRHITEPAHRLAMVQRAIQANPFFNFSTIEIDRPGPSYTVDTLEQLTDELGADARLFLIVGWDSLLEIPQWKTPRRISELATLTAFPRPGYSRPSFDALDKTMPGISGRVIMFDEPDIGISSTMIRERISEGRSIRYLVPDAVFEYIREHGLYTVK